LTIQENSDHEDFAFCEDFLFALNHEDEDFAVSSFYKHEYEDFWFCKQHEHEDFLLDESRK